jgi:hypothetical protein
MTKPPTNKGSIHDPCPYGNDDCPKCNPSGPTNTDLDLDDEATYELYHLAGAIANTCFAEGVVGGEDAVLPDFDEDVKDILAYADKQARQREVAALLSAEVWLPIEGYENLYEVSSAGRVRSLNRKTTKGKILQPVMSPLYYRVTLSKDNVPHGVSVHRLVATAFLPNPEGKRNVNHLDGNKINNAVNNLEWATHKENENHSFKVLGKKTWNKDTAKIETINCQRCGVVVTDLAWKNRKFCSKSCGARYVRTKGIDHLTQQDKTQ